MSDLSRYTIAHKRDFETALDEINSGKKISHWMWYIFPQLRGLGKSTTSAYYGIADIAEAKAFLEDEYLGDNLRRISYALLELQENNPAVIMGKPDDKKLRSSMTLFYLADPSEEVFKLVLTKLFDGKLDGRTVRILNNKQQNA